MKKFTAALSVFVALLMMAIPLTASAEQIAVAGVQIVDPVVTVNGAPMLDMTGLTVQLAGGSTADGSLTQVFLDVFAGGNNVGSAVLQLDDQAIVGKLGGMQSAYGVDFATLGAMPIEGLNMNFSALMAALKNWDLPDKLAALMEETMAKDMVMGDPEAIELDLAAGKTTLTYVPFTMDGTNYILSLYELIENDALLGPMIQSSLADSGYDSFTDMLKDSGMTLQITGGMASTDDASTSMVEMTATITSDEETVTEEIYLLMDGSMGDTQTIDATVTVNADEESMTAAMTGTVVGEDMTLEGTITENGEEAATFTLAVASSALAGAGSDTFDLTVATAEGETFALSASENISTGETHFEVAYQDEYTQFSGYLTYTLAATLPAGAIAGGKVELGAKQGADEYTVTANVNVIVATIESDNYYIDPATATDLITMTPEQSEAATTDLMLTLMTMLRNIETAVPGLAGMSAGLFGNTMQ